MDTLSDNIVTINFSLSSTPTVNFFHEEQNDVDELVQCFACFNRGINNNLSSSNISNINDVHWSEKACIWANGTVDCGGGTIDEHKCIACVWSSDQAQLWQVPKSAVYGTLFVTGFIGNWLAIVAIMVVKSMHTPTNFYLLNLSFSDMLLVLFGIPVELFGTWQQYPWIFGTQFCRLQNFIREFSTYLSVMTVMAFSIERYIAICHPFVSLRASKHRTYRVIFVVWLLSIIHALPALIFSRVTFLQYADSGEPLELSYDCRIQKEEQHLYMFFMYSLVVSFVLPFVVIIYVYAHIACVVSNSASDRRSMQQAHERQSTLDAINRHIERQHSAAAAADSTINAAANGNAVRHWLRKWHPPKRQRRATTAAGTSSAGHTALAPHKSASTIVSVKKINHHLRHAVSQDSTTTGGHREAAKSTVLRMLFTVVIAFIICYGAFHGQRVLSMLPSTWIEWNDHYYAYQVMFFISCTLYFLHPTINPIVYCLHSQQFRRAFQQLLTCSTAECVLRKRRRRSSAQLLPAPTAAIQSKHQLHQVLQQQHRNVHRNRPPNNNDAMEAGFIPAPPPNRVQLQRKKFVHVALAGEQPDKLKVAFEVGGDARENGVVNPTGFCANNNNNVGDSGRHRRNNAECFALAAEQQHQLMPESAL